MRPNPGELYEEWCYRAAEFEKEAAMLRISKGEEIELIFEEMSKKLLAKMMHPLYEVIYNDIIDEYDSEKSKKEYEVLYLDLFFDCGR